MRTSELYKPRQHKSRRKRIVKLILSAYIIAILVRFFLIEGFAITINSMNPELKKGDRVVINKILYGFRLPLFNSVKLFTFVEPSRGDIIAFYQPTNDLPSGFGELIDLLTFSIFNINSEKSINIKRVVAVSGNRIRIDKDGFVFVNGKKIKRKLIGRFSIKKIWNNNTDCIVNVYKDKTKVHTYEKKEYIGSRYHKGFSVEHNYVRYLEKDRIVQFKDVILSEDQKDFRTFPQSLNSREYYMDIALRFIIKNIKHSDSEQISILKYSIENIKKIKEQNVLLYNDEGEIWYRLKEERKIKRLFVKKGDQIWMLVPEDSFFVLGDNRDESVDSRRWGLVNKKYIIGSKFINY